MGETNAPVRIKNDADIVAVIPYLLGFQPADSVVGMVFADRKLITTVRFPIEMGDSPAALAARLGVICRQFPEAGWILAGYSPDRRRAAQLIEHMTAGIGEQYVLESIYVNGGRYWSLSCKVPGCCPAEGRLIDTGASPVSARAVLAGMQVLESRAQLDESIRPPRGWAARAAINRMADARASICHLDLVQIEETFEKRVREGLADPAQVSGDDAAMLAAMAYYPTARDRALSLLTRHDAERHVDLWQVVARLTPRDSQPPVLGLLGLAAWVSGNGALQVVCVERAEKVAPNHPLVRLVADINAAAAPPSVWDQLRIDLFGEEEDDERSETPADAGGFSNGRQHDQIADLGNDPPR